MPADGKRGRASLKKKKAPENPAGIIHSRINAADFHLRAANPSSALPAQKTRLCCFWPTSFALFAPGQNKPFCFSSNLILLERAKWSLCFCSPYFRSKILALNAEKVLISIISKLKYAL
jgi:hypothetical protein